MFNSFNLIHINEEYIINSDKAINHIQSEDKEENTVIDLYLEPTSLTNEEGQNIDINYDLKLVNQWTV